MGSPPQGGDHQAKAAGASMGAPAGLALWQQRLCPKQPPGTQAHGHWSSRGQCDDHQVTPSFPLPCSPTPEPAGHTLTSPLQPVRRALRLLEGRGADTCCAAGVPKTLTPVVGAERACVQTAPHMTPAAPTRPQAGSTGRWTFFLLPQTQLPVPGSLRWPACPGL